MGAWPKLTALDLDLCDSSFDAKTFACCAWRLEQLHFDRSVAFEPAFTALSYFSDLKTLTLSYMQGALCSSEPSMRHKPSGRMQHKVTSIWPDLQHLQLSS